MPLYIDTRKKRHCLLIPVRSKTEIFSSTSTNGERDKLKIESIGWKSKGKGMRGFKPNRGGMIGRKLKV